MPYGTLALDAISTSGNLTVTGNLTANTYNLVSQTLGTATPGKFEYDGRVPYFTPAGTQRGVIPGMQYYRLDSAVVGSNATGAQNTLGVGVTLNSSTVYAFELFLYMNKTAGATSHTISHGFGGTATVNNIMWHSYNQWLAGSSSAVGLFSGPQNSLATSTAQTVASTALANAATFWYGRIAGTVSINAGGTLIPQYSLSAAPGGAYSTLAGSYFLIYPVGSSGNNVSVGTWA